MGQGHGKEKRKGKAPCRKCNGLYLVGPGLATHEKYCKGEGTQRSLKQNKSSSSSGKGVRKGVRKAGRRGRSGLPKRNTTTTSRKETKQRTTRTKRNAHQTTHHNTGSALKKRKKNRPKKGRNTKLQKTNRNRKQQRHQDRTVSERWRMWVLLAISEHRSKYATTSCSNHFGRCVYPSIFIFHSFVYV